MWWNVFFISANSKSSSRAFNALIFLVFIVEINREKLTSKGSLCSSRCRFTVQRMQNQLFNAKHNEARVEKVFTVELLKAFEEVTIWRIYKRKTLHRDLKCHKFEWNSRLTKCQPTWRHLIEIYDPCTHPFIWVSVNFLLPSNWHKLQTILKNFDKRWYFALISDAEKEFLWKIAEKNYAQE